MGDRCYVATQVTLIQVVGQIYKKHFRKIGFFIRNFLLDFRLLLSVDRHMKKMESMIWPERVLSTKFCREPCFSVQETSPPSFPL